MKHLLLSITTIMFAGAAFIPSSAFAAPVSPDEALARLNADASMRKIARAPQALSLVKTYITPSGKANALYVFDRPSDGFIILAADDHLPALIATVNGDKFNADKIPADMKWWLSLYQREAEYTLAHPQVMTQASDTETLGFTPTDKRRDIEPLVTSRWNQLAPYNNHCPYDEGGQCVTGCVATAMAQVIRYHQWPRVAGFGSHEYSFNGNVYSYDFTAHSFDWPNMLDDYEVTPGNDRQNDAVANLMLACGVGVEMQYTSDMSGAMQACVPGALANYFGYSPKVSYLQRDYFTTRDWVNRIYTELAAGRPVIMGGASEEGGHCFVCDGYDNVGLFHFNWGWGGYCDGYFLMTALNPLDTGVGATVGDFNSNVDAVVNIAPPASLADVTADCPLIATGDMYAEPTGSSADRNYYNILFSNGGIFNFHHSTVEGAVGLQICDPYGEILTYTEDDYATFDGFNTTVGFTGYFGYSAYIPTDLTADSYLLFPVFRPNGGEWQRIPTCQGNTQFLVLTVGDDGSMTFTDGWSSFRNVEVTEFYPVEMVYKDQAAKYVVTIDGLDEGHYTIPVILFVGNHEDSDYAEAMFYFDVNNDKTIKYVFDGMMSMDPGTYNVYFKDEAGNVISGDFSLQIFTSGEESILTKRIVLDSYNVSGKIGDQHQINATVEPSNATIKNLAWEADRPSVASVNTNGLLTFHAPGKCIVKISALDGSGVFTYCHVTVEDHGESGVAEIDFADDARVFTTEGILIYSGEWNPEVRASLPAGIYILRTPEAARKIAVK